MAITQRNTPLLHRKEWQMMTPAPAASAAGAFVIAPNSGNFNNSLYFLSNTAHYIYNHDEDAFMQIPSGAFAGAFGAGACGTYHPWSINYTATGGSTTTVTVAAASFNITGRAVGQTIEFISAGTASGFRTTITSILNNAGAGTITLGLASAAPTAILNTHTFRISTGKFYALSAGTLAAGSFKVFDVATMAWQANLSITNLPATWGTDGEMCSAYTFGETFATGTATAGAASTLTNGAKAWATNQWANYQVRITAGTGIGQVRTIASNTGTVLTVSANWTTNPDATSQYVIEANEDYLYVLGNNAVTMYRYSISANTWTVLSPGVARAAAPGAGMGAVPIGITGDTGWANENAILNGRYIYSLRAGGSSAIDRYDIAANSWAAVALVNAETFTTGSAIFNSGEYIYMRKDATNRFFKYSVVDNAQRPLTTNQYPDGTAIVGSKLWVKNLQGSSIQWLYSLQNTGVALHRMMLY